MESNNFRNSLINETESENINFDDSIIDYIVWCDENYKTEEKQITSYNINNIMTKEFLKFDNVNELILLLSHCEETNKKIFLVISGRLCEPNKEFFCKHDSIHEIIVFCFNLEKHLLWTTQYKKISLTTSYLGDIYINLFKKFNSPIEFSERFNEINITVRSEILEFYRTLLILFESNKISLKESKEDSINFLNDNFSIYKGKDKHLKHLISDIQTDKLEVNIINWYLKDCFLHFMINDVLSKSNPMNIFKLRYILGTLDLQLTKLRVSSDKLPKELFHVSSIDTETIESIMQKRDKNILIQGYSTVLDKKNQLNKLLTKEKNNNVKLGNKVTLLVVIHILDNIDSKISKIPFMNSEYLLQNNLYLSIDEIKIMDRHYQIKTSINNKMEDHKLTYEIIDLVSKNYNNDYFYMIKIFLFLNMFNESYEIIKTLENKHYENEDIKNSEIHYLFGIFYFARKEMNKACVQFEKALEIFPRLEKSIIIAECYYKLGVIYETKEQKDEALKYFNLSYSISRELIGETNPMTISIFENIGNIYLKKGFFTEAINYLIRSLQAKSSLYRNNIDIPKLIFQIAQIYHKNLLNYSESIFYYQQLIDMLTEKYNNVLLDFNFVNLKNNYILLINSNKNIGIILSLQKDYKTSMEYFEKCLGLLIKTGDLYDEYSEILYLISNLYLETKQFEKAKDFAKQSLDIKLKLLGENHISIATCYENLANIYDCEGRSNKAIMYYEKALKIKILNISN